MNGNVFQGDPDSVIVNVNIRVHFNPIFIPYFTPDSYGFLNIYLKMKWQLNSKCWHSIITYAVGYCPYIRPWIFLIPGNNNVNNESCHFDGRRVFMVYWNFLHSIALKCGQTKRHGSYWSGDMIGDNSQIKTARKIMRRGRLKHLESRILQISSSKECFDKNNTRKVYIFLFDNIM